MVQSSCETSLSLTQCFNWRAATAWGCQTKPIRESVTRSRINQSQPSPPQYAVQEAQSSEASFVNQIIHALVLWEPEKEAPHAAVPPADPSLPSASSCVAGPHLPPGLLPEGCLQVHTECSRAGVNLGITSRDTLLRAIRFYNTDVPLQLDHVSVTKVSSSLSQNTTGHFSVGNKDPAQKSYQSPVWCTENI